MPRGDRRRGSLKAFGTLVAAVYALLLGLALLSDGRWVDPWLPLLFYAGLATMVGGALLGAALGRATMIGTPFWQRGESGRRRPAEEEARLRRRAERAQVAILLTFLLGLSLAGLALLLWQLPL